MTNHLNEAEITLNEMLTLPNRDNYEVYDTEVGKWVKISDSCFLKAGRGYAPVEDPFNAITAITVYLDWLDKLITLAVPPKTLSWESASEIAAKFDDTFLFEREADMLDTFLSLIEDADIVSGWNSEGYDIPYIVGRIIRTLAKDDLRRLCLWDQMPKKREFERYGAKSFTYDTVGRVHLDYMQLYIKYTYEERHSYSLDAIGEYELNEHKIAYEGSLDQLYNQDFYKFLDYNRQDVVLLKKLDLKLRFIDLANELAHDNTVLLATTMGAVAITDQAIINEAHQQGFVVMNRRPREEKEENEDGEITIDEDRAAGAYVATPKTGMHKYIGAIDINSLYPSTLRALNMSPETIVGQIRPIMTEKLILERMSTKYVGRKKYVGSSFAAAWDGLFGSLEYQAMMNCEDGTELTIDWDDGNVSTHTAAEVYELMFKSNQPWIISANGTIFNSKIEGIIPGLLRRWYAERKELQKKKREATDAKEIAFWDKRQLVKKINLNSLYGALLNPGCRFGDQRMGQSTTLSGRVIAKHMDAKVNECITGVYDHVGESVIYGDSVTGDSLIKTDSGEITIAEMFDQCPMHDTVNGKEYGFGTDSKVIGFDISEDAPLMSDVSFVIRHKTKKKLYRITTSSGNQITVTEDHSIMVDRDGFTMEIKPTQLQEKDLIIELIE